MTQTWLECDKLYVAPDGNGPQFVFLNNYTPPNGFAIPAAFITPDVFHTIDLADMGIPLDCKSINLAGRLLITHGQTSEVGEIHLTFRPYGEVGDPQDYIMQTCEGSMDGGQRSNVAAWMPVREGKIDVLWHAATPGTWPTHCSYGVNLVVSAWAK